jgi:hypothetical protein
LKEGKTASVSIRSEAGKPCVITSPWKDSRPVVKDDKGRPVTTTKVNNRFTFQTTKGVTYTLSPSAN